jgi:hypothetical protein
MPGRAEPETPLVTTCDGYAIEAAGESRRMVLLPSFVSDLSMQKDQVRPQSGAAGADRRMDRSRRPGLAWPDLAGD